MTKQVSLAKASAVLGRALAPAGKAKRSKAKAVKDSPAKAAKVAAREKKASKAPGNAAALRQKANDNLKGLAEKKTHPDHIASIVTSNDGNYIVVSSNGGETLARLRSGDNKEFRALSGKGMSFSKLVAWNKANPAPKPNAKLARGVEIRQAPHSAKAVADQPRAEEKSKASKKTTPKAAKNKAPSKGTERTYAKGKTENTAKVGTWRHHMLTVIQKNTSTEKAKAAHAKSGKFSDNKLDFNWANAQGYIVFAK